LKVLLLILMTASLVSCAGAVKRADGSEVPRDLFKCAGEKEIGVSLHGNVAYLYMGMSRIELQRQAMRDGMIIFSDGKHTLSYKKRNPILSIEGKDYGECVEFQKKN
jgi:hypothetical protein